MEVQLIYNVSSLQQSDSFTHVYVFHYRLLQDIECCSLCYTVGPYAVLSRSVVSDSENPLTPLSMEFPRQESQSGLPFHALGDLLDPGIEPVSLESPAFAGGFFTTMPPGKPGGLYFYLLYTQQCVYVNAKCQIYPSHPFPIW